MLEVTSLHDALLNLSVCLTLLQKIEYGQVRPLGFMPSVLAVYVYPIGQVVLASTTEAVLQQASRYRGTQPNLPRQCG